MKTIHVFNGCSKIFHFDPLPENISDALGLKSRDYEVKRQWSRCVYEDKSVAQGI